MNAQEKFVAFYTILRKEVVRFFRIWPQTLLPPVITQSLYFLIFGAFIGLQVNDVGGVPYMAFIVPGLVMMAVITSSFANVVSSFFGAKFQRNIEELLVSPTPSWIIIVGYSFGGVLRGLLVGLIVFLVSFFFTHPVIHDGFVVVVFIFFTALLFSLAGFLNSIFAQKFDDIGLFQTFILTPLTYLGGVFYSVKDLPEFWQMVSKLNPIFYMVDGFRYGFFGFSDVDVRMSVFILLIITLVLFLLNLFLIRKGVGLKT